VATRTSGLLHEAGFQADGHAVHLAGDLVIALQADGFGLRSPERGCVPRRAGSAAALPNVEAR